MDMKNQKKHKWEIRIMRHQMNLQKNAVRYTKELDVFIEKLKKQKNVCKEDAFEDAKSALIRTGVLTKSGRAKKKIVS